MVATKLKLGSCRGTIRGWEQLLLLPGRSAHRYRAVRIGAAANVFVEHLCKIGTLFASVVVGVAVVIVIVEVL